MRILHVISDKNIGGAGILLLNLLSCIQKEPYEHVVALPHDSILAERVLKLQIPILRLRHDCDRPSHASVLELYCHIKKSNIQIVHANAAICARIAGRLCGIRVVHTRHCCFPLSGKMKLFPIRFLAGMWNRFLSDRVIATAEAAKRDLLLLGIPKKQISVIVNGSHEIRSPHPQELEMLRATLGLLPTDFTVGICARLEECKGHEVLLQAAKILLKANAECRFRFLIIGEGSRKAFLEAYARQLGIEDAVRFVGFVSDPAPYYHLMRVNVNCSLGTETSCLALSEGMSASLPMIASDYGGNRAMIGDGAAGFLYPAGDSRALAERILRIASDPALEANMRTAARNRYLHCYTAEQMARKVLGVYRNVLAEKMENVHRFLL